MREVADAPINAIRRLTELLDDPQVPQIRVLEEAQAIALGTTTLGEAPDADAVEHPIVCRLLTQMGWPDIDSVPRRALNQVLNTLQRGRCRMGSKPSCAMQCRSRRSPGVTSNSSKITPTTGPRTMWSSCEQWPERSHMTAS